MIREYGPAANPIQGMRSAPAPACGHTACMAPASERTIGACQSAWTGRLKTWGIRQRVIFVAVMPATFIAIVLAAYFLLLRYADAEKQLADRGQALIRLLTPAAEYGVFSGNREELQQLATSLTQSADVKTVIIYDRNGMQLAQAGDASPVPGPQALHDGWSDLSGDDRAQTLHAKIWPTTMAISDPLNWAGENNPERKAIGSITLVLSRAELLSRKQEMMAVTLSVALLALALATLLALRLSADVSAPILALQQVVERIRSGQLEVRAARHPANTLRSLEDGINDMAAALMAGRDQLENRIAKATAELQQKKEDAELASIAKSRFLAAASHDLRQPLHALVLFSAELMSKADSTASRRLAGQINAAIASLGELLDGLLDFSRVDLGAARPELQATDLDALLARVIDMHRSSAQSKGLHLRHHRTRIHVMSDPLLLYRMVSNLVANALRYTERGGVLVGVRRAGGKARIEVWDTGIGIPEEHRSLVFQEFYQTDNPERNPRKGLGLGLSLVERLARLLDHPLSLNSAPGKGSVFGITLPRCLPAAAPNAGGPAIGAAGDFDAFVLVVGMDETTCESLCRQLHGWGCRTTCIATADAATGRSRERPDLILFDGSKLDEARQLLESYAASGPAPAMVLIGGTSVNAGRWPAESRVMSLEKPVRPAKLRALLHHLLDEDSLESEDSTSAL